MKIYYTTQFKKDYKRMQKQDKNMDKLKEIIEKLSANISLDPKYHDHSLAGEWSSHRDCHIEPDWILIYRKTADSLYLERMGSHSDLFR
ncbi:type II toxin-antitoxin system mRNA interferase toxin, RelE/StbE family [candidate division KSB1 bacterium]|nr:type II toxin-antitoxin system mRNA interferase toxin, RelE/StbE family [candidate division KSB1 bacterium]